MYKRQIRYSKTKDLNYCYGQYADIFDPIIETLIANGKGIEINTAGQMCIRDSHTVFLMSISEPQNFIHDHPRSAALPPHSPLPAGQLCTAPDLSLIHI